MRSSILVAVLGLSVPACLTGSGSISGGDDDTTPVTCGNGTVDSGETCDDGNTANGDGCSATCQMEAVPALTASLDKTTVDTELGKTELVNVTLTSVMGFAGAVSITATIVDAQGAPVTGYTVLATPPSVDVPSGGTGTTQISVKIPTDATELAPTVKIEFASTVTTPAVTSAFTV